MNKRNNYKMVKSFRNIHSNNEFKKKNSLDN